MPSIEIRQLPVDEAAAIRIVVPAYAFAEDQPPTRDPSEAAALAKSMQPDQYFVLYEDGQPVATTGNTPMTQNVRGQIVPMWGVWNVAVLPQARRKGYARQLIQRMLAETRAAGSAYSTLYPFRQSFYRRMGYALYPQARTATIPARDFLSVFKMNLPGAVRWGTYQEMDADYRDFLRTVQQTMHGMAITSDARQDQTAESGRFYIALAEVGSQAVGGMVYRIEGDGPNMIVPRFFYTTSAGKYLLLDWFARHVDQVEDVRIKLPPAEHPELWLTDLDITLKGAFTPMGRVADVMGLAGLPVGDGRFTVQVDDPLCGWNNGALTFQGTSGKLSVTRAASAEYTLTIQGLSALVYGTHDPADFPLMGWSDADPATLAEMGRVFPRLMPYLHETF